jgi:ribose transport system permease protein
MISLDTNRAFLPARADWRRDMVAAGLLLVLMLGLLVWWRPGKQLHLSEIAKPMAGRELLVAMAMLIALRLGVIDLSVWVLAGLSGVLSGQLMVVGVPPWVAMALTVLAGALVGLLKSQLIRIPHAPAAVVTLAIALVGWGVGRWVCPEGITVGVDTFQSWLMTGVDQGVVVTLPLAMTRILLVLGGFLLSMTVCLGLLTRDAVPVGPFRSAAGLTFAGALLGLAGACQLLDSHTALPPQEIVGDFRVLAAVVLAGGVLFIGPGRDRLTGLLLPVALLAATLWEFLFADWGRGGYEWGVLVLAAGAIGIQIILRCFLRGAEQAPAIFTKTF